MKAFLADDARDLLARHGLDSFDALWRLEADWFEPPNHRRGGWSGVARIELQQQDGDIAPLFLKRQANHRRRTLRHPLRGEATFAGEFGNILALQRIAVPTMQPVFFGQRWQDGELQAIVVTRELTGFEPLDALVARWATAWDAHQSSRRALLRELALALGRMHAQRWVHNSLHPKHVFVRERGDVDIAVSFIDLEKMRRARSALRAAMRDLDSLNRRSQHWSATDRLRFLDTYLNAAGLGKQRRRLWRYLATRRAGFLKRKASGQSGSDADDQ